MKRHNGVCYIVAAGEKAKLTFVTTKFDYVIAADGGYQYLKESGIMPDLLIGDMDSVTALPDDLEIIKLPADKDDTDTMAAIRIGIAKGYATFHIFCATGGRRGSHTIANIQALVFLARQGKRGFLFSDTGTMTVIHNDTLDLPDRKGYISIFALGESVKATIEGLKYNIQDVALSNDFPIGASNEFVGDTAKITAKNGSLLIVYDESF